MAVTLQQQAYLQAWARWSQTSDRSARRALVDELAGQLGVHTSTVYRRMKAMDRGQRDRPRRADAGSTALSDDDAELLAKLMARGLNKRSQPNLPLKEAVRLARERGLLQTSLSYSQIARQMRVRGLDMATMRAPEPSVRRVPKHPNHVHEVDVSVCTHWYLRKDGRQLALDPHAGRKFYEGKVDNFKALRLVLLRYLLVDVYSGAFYVRYAYERGEDALTTVDFLHRAWSAKSHGAAYPFRGIPRRVVFDRGPGFNNALVKNLLGELGLDDNHVEFHLPGNAKASGAVETTHNLWQRTFEGRMAQQPPEDLETLNRWAEAFAGVLQAEREHTRYGATRMAMWATIDSEQLVECPDRETFLQLANSKERVGTLNNHLQLRADSRVWEIEGGVARPQAKVRFRLAPFLEAGVRVWDEAGEELQATELTFNAAGYPTNGSLHHVWDADEGERKGSTAPEPAGQAVVRTVKEASAPPVDVAGLFDDLDERLERHAFLTRQGQAWTPTGSPVSAEPLIADLDAREELAREVGRTLTRAEWAWVKARTSNGLTRSALSELIADVTAGLAASPTLAQVETA